MALPVNARTIRDIRRRLLPGALGGLLIGLLSCGEGQQTAPGDRTLDAAGKPTGDPVVSATDPPDAPKGATPRGAVLGSGFDNGSVVDLELYGQLARGSLDPPGHAPVTAC